MAPLQELGLAAAGNPVFFDGWSGPLRAIIAAPVVYVGVVAFIRLSGKRSTSQMNNFDWIVTVAIGSMVASPILLEDVVVLESLAGIAALLVLQYIVTLASRKWDAFERVVKARPALVAYDGRLVQNAMRDERVTRAEVMAALREEGLTDLSEAAAIILESDASFSVIRRTELPADQSGLDRLRDIGVSEPERA